MQSEKKFLVKSAVVELQKKKIYATNAFQLENFFILFAVYFERADNLLNSSFIDEIFEKNL
jgi:hypothetical protein